MAIIFVRLVYIEWDCVGREGVDWAVEYLLSLVEGEKKEGVEPDRVMVGGFSQVISTY
jgi:hypothetical protein